MRWKLGNFEFNQKTNLLIRAEEEEQLEPKTASLLSFFIAHAGKDISRDQLIDTVWHGQIVSDSAINRAVVNLRKALGDTEKVKRFIVTVPKVGYRFICNAEEIHEQALAAQTTAPLKTTKKPTIQYIAVAALIAVALGFVFNHLNAPTFQSNNIKVSPLVRLDGVQFDVTQSYSGEKLAYSHRTPHGNAEVHLLADGSLTPQVISLRGGNASLSHWAADDSRLIYKYYTDELCQLHLVEFQGATAQAPKTLYDCVSGQDLKSLALGRDQSKLFFTEREHQHAPFILYELDLETGSKKRPPQPLPSGFGNYHIDIDPKTGRFLLLSSQSNEQSNVFELNLADNTFSHLIEKDYELRSVVWSHSGHSIVHPGRHPSHHLIETFFDGRSRVLVPDSRRISGVKRINNGRDYLYGSYLSNHNITVNGEDIPDINSSDWDYIPTYSRDGKKLAFISRRTGQDKLWIKSMESKELFSIEIPRGSHFFSSIDWSFDATKVVINSSKGIVLVNVPAGEVVKSIETGKPTHAVTWSSASAFTYSQFEGNRWQLYQYDLPSDQAHALDPRWAFALSSPNIQILVDQKMRLFQQGITEINNLPCIVPVHNNWLTYRLVGKDLYCIDKSNGTNLHILENLQTPRLTEGRIEEMRYYSVAGEDIVSTRFVEKSSDIMRTNISGRQ